MKDFHVVEPVDNTTGIGETNTVIFDYTLWTRRCKKK